jgi:hypothetical protein
VKAGKRKDPNEEIQEIPGDRLFDFYKANDLFLAEKPIMYCIMLLCYGLGFPFKGRGFYSIKILTVENLRPLQVKFLDFTYRFP